MKAHDIQLALYHESFQGSCIQKKICTVNSYLLTWEADFLSISKAGYITEYEVKISKSDYKADFNKQLDIRMKTPLFKHDAYAMGVDSCVRYSRHDEYSIRIPKHFYFVCPEGMISKDKVPTHCGLIYAKWIDKEQEIQYGRKVLLETIKQAPVLKNNYKAGPKDIEQLRIGLYFKFWKLFEEK